MEQDFTVTVTGQELNVISEALSNMPFKIAAPLIEKLRGQLQVKVNPTAEAE